METIIMSVGGSLIVPDGIDTTFLTNLKSFIEDSLQKDRKFIIIAGGGRTARRYQESVRSVAPLDREDIDWIGIHATRLNGHLLRTIFKDSAYPVMITNPDDVSDIPKDARLIVAAGYRPGASTDFRAVQIAERVDAKKMINLSNTDYIYDSDPNTNPEAKRIKEISWGEFRKLVPDTWDPGLSSPFDPVAAKEAERLNIEVVHINGTNLEELDNYLQGNPFIGTRIHAQGA